MNKLEQFKTKLKKKGISCAIFYNLDSSKLNSNFYYLSGNSCLGILIAPSSGKCFLLVPEMEMQRPKEDKDLKARLLSSKRFENTVDNILKRKNKRSIGLDFAGISHQAFLRIKKRFKRCRFHNISKDLSQSRIIKTKEEISLIRKACNITDNIFSEIRKKIRDFKTESELAAFIEYLINKNGCSPSFEPIVASAKNSSIPHHSPDRSKIKKGFLIIDFGVKYKGYCSDMTRTLFIGKPTKEQEKAYYRVLDTQKAIIKGLYPGYKGSDADKKAREKLGRHFNHSLGHGIGLDVHESPSLSPKSKDTLKEGVVFAVEPGYYALNKYGIRIEDDIVMTKKGGKALTKSQKELIIIR